MAFLFVFLGGGTGAACRYAMSLINVKTDFPLTTFAVNVIGCLAIGVLAGISMRNPGGKKSAAGMLFFRVGFCGGFTTFSTFSLETLTLFRQGKILPAALYVAVSVVCGLAGTALGFFAAKP